MATNETEIQRVENPFATLVRDERLNVGAVTIESERAVAQVKAAIFMAREYPRNKHAAMEKILEMCRRTDFAQTALYKFPRGGKSTEGLTIRAAEAIATAWGNIEFGIQELSQADGESEMLAFAWDLETNTRSSQSFRFKHERHTGQGVTKLSDPRDIYETGANLGARRLRSRILAVIDPDVKAAAEKQVRSTIAGTVSNKKTLTAKTDDLVLAFGNQGVKVAVIERYLGRPLKDILPDEYVDLANIYNAIKEGASASDYFSDMPKTAVANEAAQRVDALLTEQSQEPTTDKPDFKAQIAAKLEELKPEASKIRAWARKAGITSGMWENCTDDTLLEQMLVVIDDSAGQ